MDRADVVICSMWRNDADRNLEARAAHLLSKDADGWVWVVGDSDDDTDEILRRISSTDRRVTVVGYDTGIRLDDPTDFASRLRRLSMTANQMLALAAPRAEYVIVHESDLVSPEDVVERLMVHAAVGRHCVAGWPVIRIGPQEQFYDTWGFRAGGEHFSAWPPYHSVYRPDAPFEVDSFGSVFMLPGEAAGKIAMTTGATVELCAQLRAQGHRLWVDPTLRVEQPVELWEPWAAG